MLAVSTEEQTAADSMRLPKMKLKFRICYSVIALVALMATFAPMLTSWSPLDQDLLARDAAISAEHILGTDHFGRDVWARLLYGTQTTVEIALGGTVIAFFIGAVICIQIKLNIQSPWMPRFVTGYTTREIMLLEFSSAIMCLILAGKVGSNIASEIGTMRVTQQIDALEIMGVNSASFLILPKIIGMITMMPFLVCFSIVAGFAGAYTTSIVGNVITIEDLTLGLQHEFNEWYVWMGFIKSIFFAFIITSVSAFYGYTVEGGSVEVGKASTDSVVSSSVLILFADVLLTQILS